MDTAYFIFYTSAMILALVAMLAVLVLTWRHRQSPGARPMLALAVGTFIWALGFLLEANSATLERQLFFNNIGYIGLMSVPAAWFIFALHYTRGTRVITGWRVLPFSVIPIITIILVWTNGAHHLMWFDEHLVKSGPFTVTAKTYGTFFWIAFVHNYVLIIAGAVILIRRLFVGTRLYAGQAISLLVAVGLPLIWNFIYVFNLVPLPRKDLTPAMFAVSGVVLVVGVLRFNLFSVVPFAREFLIQQLNSGLLVFDMQNRLLEANPAVVVILGVDKNIIGSKLDSLNLSSPALKQLLTKNNPGIEELPLIVSGKERFYEVETMPINDNHQEQVGWLAVLREITERKEMQQQLIAQDRLASIGELTAGIAHELNNPLTSIVGFSELIMKRDLPNDIKSELKIINDEAERAAKIIDNLLTFARKQPENKSPLDFNEVVKSTVELRSYKQRLDNLNVVTHLASDLPEVMGSSLQLRQVVLNIIINAEFFMTEAHGKGTLIITTENKGDYIRATFADDGPGVPEQNIPKIFSPFFTTKEVGKGTGLGLSICQGIITEHGGKIWVESKPGEGATFTVELPAIKSRNK